MSQSNALVGEWLDCLTPKGIRKQEMFIIAGSRAVSETLERFPSLARSLFICVDRHLGRDSIRELIQRARSVTASTGAPLADSAAAAASPAEPRTDRFTIIALARPIFDQLDSAGTHEPLLLARTPEISEADLTKAPEGLEILCALGDPANVGALLRSAAAFGASKVILLKECATPFHPKAIRSSSASTLLTPLSRGPSIRDLPDLAAGGRAVGPLLALDMNGKSLSKFEWPKNCRLLIGEEGQGVPSSKAFEYLSIAMNNDVESLNATVAASIALFSYSQS